MEINEKLIQFAERIESIKDSIHTEEATKTSMIMPFFQLLGYDVFNPLEFVPEYIADVGIKKGEKIDYAIIIDDAPLIFIECKTYGENLNKHNSQLFRYFSTTLSAKFGILTDGVTYKFFTDLEEKNRMDDTPFLTFNLLSLQDRDVMEIKKFTRETLDVDNILNSAENLKYNKLIKDWFSREIESPSIKLIKLALSDFYEGVKSQKVIEKFAPLVKRALQQYINDTMNAKIKSALTKGDESDKDFSNSEDVAHEKKINTTFEEIEAFAIVKSILRKEIDCERITHRDTESYFGILLDDNNRKWICRMHLNGGNKFITISDDDKKPVRYDISELDDIYNYQNEIISAVKKYL